MSSRKDVPTQFAPKFLDDLDGRLAWAKELRRRFDLLCEHAGVDSFQREILAKRVIFLDIVLETIEANFAESEKVDSEDLGRWIQGCNALSGLCAKLGLERAKKEVESLQDYVKSKKG